MHREQLGGRGERGDGADGHGTVGGGDRPEHPDHRLRQVGHLHVQRARESHQDHLLAQGRETARVGGGSAQDREREEGGQGDVPVLREKRPGERAGDGRAQTRWTM